MDNPNKWIIYPKSFWQNHIKFISNQSKTFWRSHLTSNHHPPYNNLIPPTKGNTKMNCPTTDIPNFTPIPQNPCNEIVIHNLKEITLLKDKIIFGSDILKQMFDTGNIYIWNNDNNQYRVRKGKLQRKDSNIWTNCEITLNEFINPEFKWEIYKKKSQV